MEASVKDLDSDINPTFPEPRFAIGNDWKQAYKSMNSEGQDFILRQASSSFELILAHSRLS